MRANAHLYVRPNACRFMPPGAPRHVGKDAVKYFWPDPEGDPLSQFVTGDADDADDIIAARARERQLLAEYQELLKLKSDMLWLRLELKFRQLLRDQKYRADQPRVPAGQPEGGQWTTDGGGGITDRRVLSDESPDPIKLGARYAEGRRSSGGPRGPIIINGRPVDPTPAQAARLAIAEAQAQSAIRRVQELDPSWKPPASAYETVEGLIRSYQANAQSAQARIRELQRNGIGPGSFAGESIPARGPERDFTSVERSEGNRIGSETGCHTCGTKAPNTPLGNFVLDHQPPTALNWRGASRRLYPQCWACSRLQGGWVRSLIRGK